MYRCFDELDDAVVILDRNNNVTGLNRSFREIFGVDDEAVWGMEADGFFIRHITPHILEGGGCADRVLEAIRSRQEVSHLTFQMQMSHGDVRCSRFRAG